MSNYKKWGRKSSSVGPTEREAVEIIRKIRMEVEEEYKQKIIELENKIKKLEE